MTLEPGSVSPSEVRRHCPDHGLPRCCHASSSSRPSCCLSVGFHARDDDAEIVGAVGRKQRIGNAGKVVQIAVGQVAPLRDKVGNRSGGIGQLAADGERLAELHHPQKQRDEHGEGERELDHRHPAARLGETAALPAASGRQSIENVIITGSRGKVHSGTRPMPGADDCRSPYCSSSCC